MAQIKHQNNGLCPKCKEIFEAYPNFSQKLRGWFILLQSKHPEAHISCAGRGFLDQEAKKESGASRASYGQSAHNWNAAIDIFILLPNTDIYDEKWFDKILAPEIPFFINWYGAKGSVFYELPHLELREWRGLKIAGDLNLVEPMPEEIA